MAKAKGRTRLQKVVGDRIHGTTKGQCDKEDSCSFKHDAEKRQRVGALFEAYAQCRKTEETPLLSMRPFVTHRPENDVCLLFESLLLPSPVCDWLSPAVLRAYSSVFLWRGAPPSDACPVRSPSCRSIAWGPVPFGSSALHLSYCFYPSDVSALFGS